MRYLTLGLVVIAGLLTSCSSTPNSQYGTSTDSAQAPKIKPSLLDSIDQAIYGFEQRLDIKMKRKVYEPKPKTLVTIQKWFEFGDTTRLVKLRYETLTSDTKLAVEQYHFIEGKLAKMLDYTYNKQCGKAQQQCMDEAKYYFADDTLTLAQKRHAEGTPEHTPVIEQAYFVSFKPTKAELAARAKTLAQINQKYASLPYPKPRPEKGTPVPPVRP